MWWLEDFDFLDTPDSILFERPRKLRKRAVNRRRNLRAVSGKMSGPVALIPPAPIKGFRFSL